MRGSIVKRGKTWSYVLPLGRDVDGKRRQKWVGGFATKAEAEDGLIAALHRLRSGTYADPGRMTVAEFFEQWLEVKVPSLRPTTAFSYTQTIQRHVVARLGHVRLGHLTPMDLSSFNAKLLTEGRLDGTGGLSARSVTYIHRIVSAALKDAVLWGLLPSNPAAAVRAPRFESPEMRTWSPEEVRTFLAGVAGDRLYAMWVVLVSTGMRRGEVLGLRWRDVDLDAGVLSVRQSLSEVNYRITFTDPKTTKSRRQVSLDAFTVKALRTHRTAMQRERLALGVPASAVEHDLVFTRPDGSPTQPQNITQAFENIIRRLELPRIRLHDLRHTSATLALSLGIHPKIVSERLGHSTINITLDTYSHVIPGLQDAAAAALGAAIFGDALGHDALPG